MKGQTPLDAQALTRAAGEGDVSRVRSLLAAGADVNATAESGETALMRASARGHLDVVEALLNAGGDVHAKSENGFTPFFMAVFFGHVEVARALLAGGSDPSEPTRVNTTAEKWARSWGSAEIVKLLDEAVALRARELEAEGEPPIVFDKTVTQPVFFPPGGEIRPVVPLTEFSDAWRDDGTTPPSEAVEVESESGEGIRPEVSRPVSDEQRDAPDETTHVPARPNHAATTHSSRPTIRRKGARQSWRVPLLALTLSLVVGLIAGTYIVKFVRSAATRQPATEPLDTAIPVGSESAATQAAPNGDGSEARVTMESKKEAVPVPKLVAREPAGPPDAELTSPRVAISDERAARRSVERSTAGNPERDDKASKPTRSAERASSGPPKHSLPISPPPPSAESKKVIQWP